jgi:glycosyltransferase involved in cell wall biosynthesis
MPGSGDETGLWPNERKADVALASILVLSDRLPYPLVHGAALRVYHMARELGRLHECHLVSTGTDLSCLEALRQTGVFRSITTLAGPPMQRSIGRHWRLTNEHLQRAAYPAYYRTMLQELGDLVVRWRVEVVIATTLELSEYIRPLRGVRKVVDDCDCHSLTIERQLQSKHVAPRWPQRFSRLIHLRRTRAQEGHLLGWADMVSTVSPADAGRLQELHGTNDSRIRVVPNGVTDIALTRSFQKEELPNTICFWGTLNFEPNYAAVWYFYREIFLPYLRANRTVWYIMGPDPSPELVRLSKDDESIRVTGFIDDLYSMVAKIPVVVNPMIVGTGLKNKVLEAFALRKTVISTSLGVEAIKAVNGVHYLRADTPASFAEAVGDALTNASLRSRIGEAARALVLDEYTWSIIGSQWLALVDQVLATPRATHE